MEILSLVLSLIALGVAVKAYLDASKKASADRPGTTLTNADVERAVQQATAPLKTRLDALEQRPDTPAEPGLRPARHARLLDGS